MIKSNYKNLANQLEKSSFIENIIKDKFSFFLQIKVGASNISQNIVSERIFLDSNM